MRSSKNSHMCFSRTHFLCHISQKGFKTTYLEMFRGDRSGKFKKLPVTAQIFNSYKGILVDLSLANRHETIRRGGSEYEVK